MAMDTEELYSPHGKQNLWFEKVLITKVLDFSPTEKSSSFSNSDLRFFFKQILKLEK